MMGTACEITTPEKVSVGDIFSLEIAQEHPDLSPLFRLAQLSRQWWIGFEESQLAGLGKAWLYHRSSIDKYSAQYREVSEEETIPQCLDAIYQEKGSVVSLIIGTDDNPLEKFMHARNSDGVIRAVTISVCLKDRRSSKERIADAARGWYVVEGTIGSPEVFEQTRLLLGDLFAKGMIAKPFIDAGITRIIGGMGNIPFKSNIPEIGRCLTDPEAIAARRVSKEEAAEAFRIDHALRALPLAQQRELFAVYRAWILSSLQSLMNPSGHVFFGEIPEDLESIVYSHVRSLRAEFGETSRLRVASSSEVANHIIGYFRYDHRRGDAQSAKIA